MNVNRLFLIVCAALPLALAGCAVGASEPVPGEGATDQTGEAAELLRTGDDPMPKGDGAGDLRDDGNTPELQGQPTIGVDVADPDPEPWHGGSKRSSNGPGKHD